MPDGDRRSGPAISCACARAARYGEAASEVLDTTKRLFDHTRSVQANVEKFLRHVRSA